MKKKIVLFLTLVVIAILLTGCTTFDNNLWNNNDQSTTSRKIDLQSIIQLTDFTNNLDHEYSSITGNGQKIIYNQGASVMLEKIGEATTDLKVKRMINKIRAGL